MGAARAAVLALLLVDCRAQEGIATYANGAWSVGVLEAGHPRIRVGAVRVWVAGPWEPSTVLEFRGVGARGRRYAVGGAASRAVEGDSPWTGAPAFDLLGLKPSETAAWTAEICRGDECVAVDFAATTPAYPDYFPAWRAKGRAGGYTLTSAFAAVSSTTATKWSGALILDEDGAGVWGVDCGSLFDGTPWAHLNALKCGVTGSQTAEADFFSGDGAPLLLLWGVEGDMTRITTGFTGLAEVDVHGAVSRLYVATKNVPDWALPLLPWSSVAGRVVYVDVMGFNHQVTPLSPSRLATIGFDSRANVTCPGWPRALAAVHGGEIVVFDRESGAVERRFSSWDTIDVCATATYEQLEHNPDCIHLNSFDATPLLYKKMNAIVVSSFFLSWVYAIDYDSGAVTWLLGACHADLPQTCGAFRRSLPRYELRAGERYDQGQHNVRVVLPSERDAGWADAVIVAFGNGGRPDRGANEKSRLVAFSLDGPPPGTAAVVWAFEDGSVSPFLGGVQPLMDGAGVIKAVLGDFGARTDPAAGFAGRENWAKSNCNSARIVEVAYPSNEETFSVAWGGRDADGGCGANNTRSWNSYRALRLPRPDAFATSKRRPRIPFPPFPTAVR